MIDQNRYSEWINSSFSLAPLEPFMILDAQGLGMIDVELIEEFASLNEKDQSGEDLLKRHRHIIVSRLWVIGAYELVRSINERKAKMGHIIEKDARKKLATTLTNFSRIRIPLTKFQAS